MIGILEKVTEAGLTLKAGCGIGYEFSTLRPKGAYVTGAGALLLDHYHLWISMTKRVSPFLLQEGEGELKWQPFDVGHPDVEDFIKAKRENGRLRQFNLSLLITNEFMEAVTKDEDWSLDLSLGIQDCQISNY
jgi:ribonucleoside-diphosphate reductase alpha chain